MDEDEEAYRSMQREGLIAAREERPLPSAATTSAGAGAAGGQVRGCMCGLDQLCWPPCFPRAGP